MSVARFLAGWVIWCFCGPAFPADDPLVLHLDLEADTLSVSHNIDKFPFAPTRNLLPGSERNLNDVSQHLSLIDHLAATILVRMNGEVIGIATEQEVVNQDPTSGKLIAESMWSLKLNHPDLTGFLGVKQTEDATEIFSRMEQVALEPDGDWQDAWTMMLSTAGVTRVQLATGDLARFEGGVFEEYNGLNASDLARLGRFRGKIQFLIYPK